MNSKNTEKGIETEEGRKGEMEDKERGEQEGRGKKSILFKTLLTELSLLKPALVMCPY